MVLPIRSLLQKVIPWEVLAALSEQLVVNGEYPRQSLLDRLLELGYQPVPLVEDRGVSRYGEISSISSRQPERARCGWSFLVTLWNGFDPLIRSPSVRRSRS